MEPGESFALNSQDNIYRFYEQIIAPVLTRLSYHIEFDASYPKITCQCTEMVNNYTRNEATKAFALTLDGMFERQLSRLAFITNSKFKDPRKYLRTCLNNAGIDLAEIKIVNDLAELHLVANVVRHGDGNSCKTLKEKAPQLWYSSVDDCCDLVPVPRTISDTLLISIDDLWRYAHAMMSFWKHMVKLPNALCDPPSQPNLYLLPRCMAPAFDGSD